MKQLITTALGLALLFSSTFIIIKMTDVLTLDDIKAILNTAHETAPVYVAATIILFLIADLFIAVPTLTVTILGGYFLGFPYGFLAGATGLLTAGTLGYAITYFYGPELLRRIYKDAAKQAEMAAIFARYGGIVLVICRAMPILPEISCCLAGATRMPFWKFFTAFLLGTIPYALIATYAGSRSSLDDPKPAIFAAMGLSVLLAAAWMILLRHFKAEQRG
ncbi:MAG: VTT domain-containing protein [Rhodospirillales bacterium]|nr:VTT domain-containing protein [Rhodospirillales bacterium]